MKRSILSFALISSCMLAAPPCWANNAPIVDAGKAQARQDFVRLSDDGAIAFRFISSARTAIFDGQLDSASTYLEDIDKELTRAREDNTAFSRDETSLGGHPTTTSTKPGSKVTWLPIHGEIRAHSQQTVTAQQEALIIAANHYLHSGNLALAATILHQRGVMADYVISALPLEQTQSWVQNARQQLAHSPYKTNQILRVIQDSVAYETVPFTSPSNTPSHIQ